MTFAACLPSELAETLPHLQRTRGSALVSFRQGKSGTVLYRMRQEGAAKVRLPRISAGQTAQAVLINTAGGLTGGDRLSFGVHIGSGARATVTTQACEKVYRSLGDTAEIATTLAAEQGGRLDWLPQETILFDQARLRRTLDVELAGDATLLAAEAVIFGRTAMGETVSSGFFYDRWRIRRDGRLVFADDLRFEHDVTGSLARSATLKGNCATATLLYVAPDAEQLVDAARLAIGESGGASAWDGKLVARIIAMDGLALRRALTGLADVLLGGAELPKAWQL